MVKQFALKALDQIYCADYFYKKAGVIVGKTVCESQIQLSLFDNLDRKKRKDINSVVDIINRKMGANKIKLAVQGGNKAWTFRQANLSPCYTTRFSDILEVRV